MTIDSSVGHQALVSDVQEAINKKNQETADGSGT